MQSQVSSRTASFFVRTARKPFVKIWVRLILKISSRDHSRFRVDGNSLQERVTFTSELCVDFNVTHPGSVGGFCGDAIVLLRLFKFKEWKNASFAGRDLGNSSVLRFEAQRSGLLVEY